MKWINRFYIFFLGIILSITTGFGIAAFYPEPTAPQYPVFKEYRQIPTSCTSTPQSAQTPECQEYYNQQEIDRKAMERRQQEYDEKMREYQNNNAGYTRTAVFLGIAVGAFLAITGVVIIKKSKLVATGLLLGGVLTAILTRLLIGLASLGQAVSGTEQADVIGYVEFFILLLLSVAVIFVGLTTLKETDK